MVAFFAAALLVVFAGRTASVSSAGSCREAGLCCTGRDGSCVVQVPGTVYNSVDSKSGRPCYCDHACLMVGDCCNDFQEVCGATDCQVSTWGHWSDCSADCGIGAMTRKRHVTRDARNGGQVCPELIQKRSCHGNKCEEKSHVKAYRETAMILPATYSPIRHLNASQDIRTNLRLRYRKDPDEENSKDYCVVFEVTKSRKACETLGGDVANLLAKGAEVCVACETAAMRRHLGYRCSGHGAADHKPTRFALLAFQQCHGRWKRKLVSDKCPCGEEGKANFIFV